MAQNRPKSSSAWTWIMLALFVGTFLCIYMWPARAPAPVGTDRRTGAVPQSKIGGPVRVSEKTEVTYQVFYERCGHKDVNVLRTPPEVMIGLSLEEFGRLFPEWHVQEFTALRLSLQKTLPTMCADDVSRRFITARDGKVIVFYGSGARPSPPVMYETTIEVTRLAKADREKLAKGIVVTSDQEVFDWLEGILE
jgi:hypothetical protein